MATKESNGTAAHAELPWTPRHDFELDVSRKLDEISRLCMRIDTWVTTFSPHADRFHSNQHVLIAEPWKCSPPRTPCTPRSFTSPRGSEGAGYSSLPQPVELPMLQAAVVPIEEPQMLPVEFKKPALRTQSSHASDFFQIMQQKPETIMQSLKRSATVLSVSSSGSSAEKELPKTIIERNSLQSVGHNASDMSDIIRAGEKRSLKGALHLMMDGTHRSDPSADVFCTCMPIFIFASLLVAYIQSMSISSSWINALRIIDLVFNVVFIIEVVIRIIIYPNKRRFCGKKLTSSQVFLYIDLAAAIPLGLLVYMDILKPAEEDKNDVFQTGRFLMYCAVPMIRLLKMLRYMVNLHLLLHAFVLLGEAIPSVLFVMFFIIVLGASLLVIFEPPSNLHSFSHAMWLVVVTMTTVGYGDVAPITTGGYIVCSALVVLSVLYMAIPIGIIGNIFTSVWADRDRILLMKTTRNRLAEWGYAATDIPSLFETFDENGKGELDIFRFHVMMENMNLDFDEKRIDAMFMQFDHDGSGTIDASKFLRHLFPKTFHQLYGKQSLRKLTMSQSLDGLGGTSPTRGHESPASSNHADLQNVPELGKLGTQFSLSDLLR